jgi:hypothetical protein
MGGLFERRRASRQGVRLLDRRQVDTIRVLAVATMGASTGYGRFRFSASERRRSGTNRTFRGGLLASIAVAVTLLVQLPGVPSSPSGPASGTQSGWSKTSGQALNNSTNTSLDSLSPSTVILPPVATAFGDWPTYDQNIPRDGQQALERTLSPANASRLTELSSFSTNGPAEGSVAAVNDANGTASLYFGDWAGYVYALGATNLSPYWIDRPNGTLIGDHGTDNCSYGGRGYLDSYPVDGVTSTPAIWGGNLYVASQQFLYDLYPLNGTVHWRVNLVWLGDQPTGGDGYWKAHYVWSSPIVYNNYVYVGISSGCDNPLVRGQLFQIPMNGTNTTGSPAHFFNVTLTTSPGGSIWSSPSIDTTTTDAGGNSLTFLEESRPLN